MLQHGDLITGDVIGLAFGGYGIIRHQGFVVFVPFTLPGETVTCRIVSKKKSFANAELVQILNKSPQRVVPKCPYFGTCGGCQLQHVDDEAQLGFKRQCVEDAFKRIGHLPITAIPSVVPASEKWAYRRHVTLSLVPNDQGGFAAGYVALNNQTVINIQQCPIFVKSEETIIQNIQSLVCRMECASENGGRVAILKHMNGKFILHFSFDRLPKNVEIICQNGLKEFNNIIGISIAAKKKKLHLGITHSSCLIDGLNVKFSPTVFMQVHPEQSANIYRYICALSSQLQSGKVLDLYCGIGITSLMLAKQGNAVIGIEGNPESIEMAKQNAQNNGFPNVKFICADVKKVIDDQLRSLSPDLVLINPPRTGMDPDVTKILLNRRPKAIIYTSCMPATLARDLQQLGKEYRNDCCQAFDMFPQTTHVETVVLLKRTPMPTRSQNEKKEHLK